MCREELSTYAVKAEPESEADVKPVIRQPTFVHRKQYLAAQAVLPCDRTPMSGEHPELAPADPLPAKAIRICVLTCILSQPAAHWLS